MGNQDSKDLVRNTSLYREFQAEKEEILRHKWKLSEEEGYDVGFEYALTDWLIRYRSKWRKSRQRITEVERTEEKTEEHHVPRYIKINVFEDETAFHNHTPASSEKYRHLPHLSTLVEHIYQVDTNGLLQRCLQREQHVDSATVFLNECKEGSLIYRLHLEKMNLIVDCNHNYQQIPQITEVKTLHTASIS